MKSLTKPDFWRSYAVLSPEVKEQARNAYRLWINNQDKSMFSAFLLMHHFSLATLLLAWQD